MGEVAYLAQADKHYKKLGLKKETQLWEDGIRTTGQKGSFEWWYADAEYSNGMKTVFTFYTKDHFDIGGPANPTVEFQITFPNGTVYKDVFHEGKNSLIRAAKDHCDVAIGQNYFRYENGNYIFHYENADVSCDSVMKPRIPMWRPATGHCFFGSSGETYFAWLVGIPSADVSTSLTYKGESYDLKGNGYHDHNWGNAPMQKILSNWYWCRVKVGPYTIISVEMIAEKKYDHVQFIPFLIARDGEIVADDSSKVTVERLDKVIHPGTNKSIHNHLVFQYVDGGKKYVLEYLRERDIEATHIIDNLGFPKPVKWLAVNVLKMDPTYVRILGNVKLTAETDGKEQVYEQEGLWEQMFFGNDK